MTTAISLSPKAEEAKELMNRCGRLRRPFIFLIDFLMQEPVVLPMDRINKNNLLFSINGITNFNEAFPVISEPYSFEVIPPSYETYCQAFSNVQRHLHYGNSFLVNLTLPSRIETSLSLKEIFYRSNAAYKLLYADRFVLFSPELFIRITGGRIESHPMKGTIDAAIPNAAEKILADPKETAEHHTIVDLIRNDLNRIAKNVRVEKFRFITPVITRNKTLLQVSSSIVGELGSDYHQNIGNLIFELLPAGSISGAPKKKTVEIILESEGYERGFYTGVFGIFDGVNLDSGVMIRFIEKTSDGLWFKSGGGITVNSRCEDEYQELVDKVYLPFQQSEK